MHSEARRLAAGLMIVASIAVGCGDGTAPNEQEQKPQDQLSFLQLGLNTPGLAATTATFWARAGENRELRLYYRPRPGRTDSTEYLRFRVRQRSLLRRPDGTSFGSNDSILVTVRVSDPTRLVVEFLPAGLQFDPNEPAELKLSFKEKGGDVNDDGKVDASDDTVKSRISIWRQESAGLPWFKLASVITQGTDEIEAKLNGFTSYAVAY